jgi:23S rRNA (cytosine1962-C5)-methyltransferase
VVTDRDGYQLLDIGDGRRLERFGDRVVDRPAPTVEGSAQSSDAWASADLRWDTWRGWNRDSVEPWEVPLADLTLELRPTPTGQVGLFPEHSDMWPWLLDRCSRESPPDVLNLFAYTGATSLMLARAGARVAHVDSSRPAVTWARRNAQLSGLAEAPIRWLVDGAEAFIAREGRRERHYAGIILDPPSYGHGAAGKGWRLDDDLPALLDGCAQLVRPEGGWALLTAHTPGWDDDRLASALAEAMPATDVEAGPLSLTAETGAVLRLGWWARATVRR